VKFPGSRTLLSSLEPGPFFGSASVELSLTALSPRVQRPRIPTGPMPSRRWLFSQRTFSAFLFFSPEGSEFFPDPLAMRLGFTLGRGLLFGRFFSRRLFYRLGAGIFPLVLVQALLRPFPLFFSDFPGPHGGVCPYGKVRLRFFSSGPSPPETPSWIRKHSESFSEGLCFPGAKHLCVFVSYAVSLGKKLFFFCAGFPI